MAPEPLGRHITFIKLSCQTLNKRLLLPNGLNKWSFYRSGTSAVLLFQPESRTTKSIYLSWDLSSLKLPPVFWEPTRNRPSTHPGGWKPVYDFLMMSESLPLESLYISWKELNWKLTAKDPEPWSDSDNQWELWHDRESYGLSVDKLYITPTDLWLIQ